jgi:tetratricopeptide (TPR) repeat protein
MSMSAGETAVALGEKSAVLRFRIEGAHFTEHASEIGMPITSRSFVRRIAGTVCLAFATAGAGALAAENDWLDVEGRIQYGFYTEDARALTDVAEQLARGEEAQEPLREYYAGLANYRLALVLASRDKGRARDAVEQCVDRLDSALKSEADFAAALALQSACLRTLSVLKPWKPLAGSKSSGQLEKAVKLAPKDPRVLMLAALDSMDGDKLDDASLARLKKAAAAFEAERQGVDRTPGWGAAEVYTYLGRGYLGRGDVLAARDALERALLIAPDFVMARRLLAKITTG